MAQEIQRHLTTFLRYEVTTTTSGWKFGTIAKDSSESAGIMKVNGCGNEEMWKLMNSIKPPFLSSSHNRIFQLIV
jgi:hypothetical protein